MSSPGTESFALQTLLQRFAISPWRTTTLPREYVPARMRKVAASVELLLRDLEPRVPSVLDLELLRVEIRNAWDEKRSIAHLPRRTLKRLPWVLCWPPEERGIWLLHRPALVAAYLEWLRTSAGGSAAVLALLKVYLRHVPEESSLFRVVGEALAGLLPKLQTPSGRRWADRATRRGFFRATGPEEFAKQCMAEGASADAVLLEAGFGLSEGLADADFALASVAAGLRQVAADLRTDRGESSLRRAIPLLESGKRLRFEEMRKRVAAGLLGPFVESRPSPTVGELLVDFFVRHYGDPRLRNHKWANIEHKYRTVILRSLVRVALEDFFRIIGEYALDRHWQQRKTFWLSYVEGDLVEDAWIVLGPWARSAAHGIDPDLPKSAGYIGRGSTDSRHSVLLMKIGGMTISEWSHNGKCRFWLPNNPHAPKLYQSEYEGYELRSPTADEEIAHRGPWEEKLARVIRQQTGVAPRFSSPARDRPRW